MAVPKQKTSRARTRRRRARWQRQRPPGRGRCSRCGEVKRPHTVCRVCGHYRGEEILEVDEG